MGICYEHARIAVIDLKSKLIEAHKAKMTTMQGAVLIIDDVRRIYRRPLNE